MVDKQHNLLEFAEPANHLIMVTLHPIQGPLVQGIPALWA
jgi:hypothetical protein